MTESAPRPALARLIVSVEKIDRSLALYREVLGLAVARQAGDLVWLSTEDGVEVMLHQRSTVSSESAVSIGFLVDDLDIVVAGWVARGGRIIDAPALQSWGERMAVVTDADGHVVCISERQA